MARGVLQLSAAQAVSRHCSGKRSDFGSEGLGVSPSPCLPQRIAQPSNSRKKNIMTNRYWLCATFSAFRLSWRSSEKTKLKRFQRQSFLFFFFFPPPPPSPWHDFSPVIHAVVDKLKHPCCSLGGGSGFVMCLPKRGLLPRSCAS